MSTQEDLIRGHKSVVSKRLFSAHVLASIAKFLLLLLLAGCAGTIDTFDKTNCEGVVLDDAMWPEQIEIDRTDESYGALLNSAARPLGGGEGYARIVPRPPDEFLPIRSQPPGIDVGVVVRTADELRAALIGGSRQTIYVDDAAEIDLSYCARTPTPENCDDPRSGPNPYFCEDFTLTIPANVTLASGRGRNGSRGALLFSRTFSECPMLLVNGPGVRITGLRIHGPDSSIENDEPIHCAEASGIGVFTDSGPLRWATEVDNNELSAWPRASIDVQGIMGVHVHHNVIQYNRRHEHNGTCDHDYGLGYGIHVGPGSAIIEANVFDHNRHDIASSGRPGSYYTAIYNLVLTGAVEQSFDVHGGADRTNDCTDIAGSAFVIHHNTFLQTDKPVVQIRGIPLKGAWMYKNETGGFPTFKQTNANGNFFVEDNSPLVDRFPAWFISFGGSTFWQWRQFEEQSLSEVATGDFDGDGAADVMRSTPSGWQWSKSGRESWTSLSTHNDPVSQLGFGNFVGLGLTDVIFANGTEWEVSESGTSPWRTLFRTNEPLSNAAFADFEGDSYTDAFFADGTQWKIVQSFSPQVVSRYYRQPYKLSELRFGNFVGDLKTDVLRSSGGEWLVWDHISEAWNVLGSSGIPLSELTFADFNGDAITDIARSHDGTWLVSWGGKSPWQLLNTTDLALNSQLIADFNGDRKSDVLSRQSPDP